ncbi:MAG TPA: hypothetical protein VGR37_02905 [Longimicrobiaceae bacterium]|nr:hypothetical protein [Longimicrobiaceae bacterium]
MEQTRPKPYVFVLMPFESALDDVYQFGIKAACSDAGAYCERVDEQLFDESILERIYNQIARADVIVADMTGRNPNVFYETGYAHALGKRVILLTQRAEDIPFDLKHFPHIIYGGRISDLKGPLETRIRWSINNPEQSLRQVEALPDIYLEGQRLDQNSNFEAEVGYPMLLNLQFALHNSSDSVIDLRVFRFAVISSNRFPGDNGMHSGPAIRLPDGRYIHHLRVLREILPQDWIALHCVLRGDEDQVFGGHPEELVLRIHSEVGHRDIPFTVNFPGYG